jgi:hypothetical protein
MNVSKELKEGWRVVDARSGWSCVEVMNLIIVFGTTKESITGEIKSDVSVIHAKKRCNYGLK